MLSASFATVSLVLYDYFLFSHFSFLGTGNWVLASESWHKGNIAPSVTSLVDEASGWFSLVWLSAWSSLVLLTLLAGWQESHVTSTCSSCLPIPKTRRGREPEMQRANQSSPGNGSQNCGCGNMVVVSFPLLFTAAFVLLGCSKGLPQSLNKIIDDSDVVNSWSPSKAPPSVAQ